MVDIIAADLDGLSLRLRKLDSEVHVHLGLFPTLLLQEHDHVVDIDHVVPVTYVLRRIASASAHYVVDPGTFGTVRVCLVSTTWLTAIMRQSANSFNSDHISYHSMNAINDSKFEVHQYI